MASQRSPQAHRAPAHPQTAPAPSSCPPAAGQGEGPLEGIYTVSLASPEGALVLIHPDLCQPWTLGLQLPGRALAGAQRSFSLPPSPQFVSVQVVPGHYLGSFSCHCPCVLLSGGADEPFFTEPNRDLSARPQHPLSLRDQWKRQLSPQPPPAAAQPVTRELSLNLAVQSSGRWFAATAAQHKQFPSDSRLSEVHHSWASLQLAPQRAPVQWAPHREH